MSMLASPERADYRSGSRGREVYRSSGRGGAGNFVSGPSSAQDYAEEMERALAKRGRDKAPISTGRGGAGNILKSPSPTAREASDRVVVDSALSVDPLHPESVGELQMHQVYPPSSTPAQPVSTGRGGAGNIFKTQLPTPPMSTSRERTTEAEGAAASRDRNAALSKERNAASSRDRNAASSRDRNAASSRDRNAAASRERKATSSRERNAAVSRERSADTSRSRSRGGEARDKAASLWDRLTHRDLAVPTAAPPDVQRGRERRVDVPSAIAE